MFLVTIHELGHFWTAKKAGVKVLEFGLWIPPKAKKMFTDKSGTEYTLNWIPLGWFVRLKGENPHADDFLQQDSFISASLPWKLLILAGGVIMNFLFARLIFAVVFRLGVKPITVIPDNLMKGDIQSYLMPTPTFLESWGYLSGEIADIPVTVEWLLPDSLAGTIGIATWAIITSVNEKKVSNKTLWLTLKEYMWQSFDITRDQDGKEQTKQLTCPEENCLLWVMIQSGGTQEILPIKMWFGEALWAGFQEILAQSNLTFSVLWSLGRNLTSWDSQKVKKSVDQLSGPVGIVKFGEWILEYWWVKMYLAFAGMISLALALFNILPIPALDWWRAVSVILQSIFKIKPEKYFAIESYFNLFFFAVLMLLGIYIILLDLQRFRGVNVPGF